MDIFWLLCVCLIFQVGINEFDFLQSSFKISNSNKVRIMTTMMLIIVLIIIIIIIIIIITSKFDWSPGDIRIEKIISALILTGLLGTNLGHNLTIFLLQLY